MNESEYKAKKKAFEEKFPLLLNEKTHFRMKILIVMLTFIVFLIAKSTLPVFDISCVNDNMFFVFEKG